MTKCLGFVEEAHNTYGKLNPKDKDEKKEGELEKKEGENTTEIILT